MFCLEVSEPFQPLCNSDELHTSRNGIEGMFCLLFRDGFRLGAWRAAWSVFFDCPCCRLCLCRLCRCLSRFGLVRLVVASAALGVLCCASRAFNCGVPRRTNFLQKCTGNPLRFTSGEQRWCGSWPHEGAGSCEFAAWDVPGQLASQGRP